MAKRDATEDQTVEEKNEDRMDTLQKYVSDMMAVEEHIGNAVKRQADDKGLSEHRSQARRIISTIVQTTERHEQALKSHLESIGGDAAKGIKEVATAALGTLAGLYDKVRTDSVSKMLRDDYTALNLAAVGYTMLHTTGLVLNDQATASLALSHLKAYTSIIMEINQIIPAVVVADLSDKGTIVNKGVLQQAVSNTQEAWQPSSNTPTSSASTTPKPVTNVTNGTGANDNGHSTTPSSKPSATTKKSVASETPVATTEPVKPKRKPAASNDNDAETAPEKATAKASKPKKSSPKS